LPRSRVRNRPKASSFITPEVSGQCNIIRRRPGTRHPGKQWPMSTNCWRSLQAMLAAFVADCRAVTDCDQIVDSAQPLRSRLGACIGWPVFRICRTAVAPARRRIVIVVAVAACGPGHDSLQVRVRVRGAGHWGELRLTGCLASKVAGDQSEELGQSCSCVSSRLSVSPRVCLHSNRSPVRVNSQTGRIQSFSGIAFFPLFPSGS